MPVSKKKPTTSTTEGSMPEPSSPVLPEPEEFRQHLRRLAVSAVQFLSSWSLHSIRHGVLCKQVQDHRKGETQEEEGIFFLPPGFLAASTSHYRCTS